MLQERGLLPGPRVGSYLTFGNELSEKTHANKARDFIGKGSRSLRELRRTALPYGLLSQTLW